MFQKSEAKQISQSKYESSHVFCCQRAPGSIFGAIFAISLVFAWALHLHVPRFEAFHLFKCYGAIMHYAVMMSHQQHFQSELLFASQIS
jgi:hypothetical protein